MIGIVPSHKGLARTGNGSKNGKGRFSTERDGETLLKKKVSINHEHVLPLVRQKNADTQKVNTDEQVDAPLYFFSYASTFAHLALTEPRKGSRTCKHFFRFETVV